MIVSKIKLPELLNTKLEEIRKGETFMLLRDQEKLTSASSINIYMVVESIKDGNMTKCVNLLDGSICQFGKSTHIIKLEIKIEAEVVNPDDLPF